MGNLLRLAFVSFGFLGCSPVIPGTVGTLGGVLMAWLIGMYVGNYIVGTVVACVVLYAVGRSLGQWAEQYAGKKDPGIFVVDEVIGYLITVAWVGAPSLLALVVAFFVFRFFDILKPRLARKMEALGGGDGILMDDVVSGFYGLALMAILRLFLLDPADWTMGAA